MNSTAPTHLALHSLPLPEGAELVRVGPSARPVESERSRIKICGLTREQDVDAAVAAGADAIGFVLYKASARYVSAQRASELAARLPPFVTPVLLFVNADAMEIIAACGGIAGAIIQFHGDETPDMCLDISQQVSRPFMRAARIPIQEETPNATLNFDLIKYAEDFNSAQAILLDAHVEGFGGGGKTFNWSLLPPSVNAHLVLSGGLTPANVGDGIAQLRLRGRSLAVDVSSGVEEKLPDGSPHKGIKSPRLINQFVAAVRAADYQFKN